jgi:deoxyribose-phosphate aldolase
VRQVIGENRAITTYTIHAVSELKYTQGWAIVKASTGKKFFQAVNIHLTSTNGTKKTCRNYGRSFIFIFC